MKKQFVKALALVAVVGVVGISDTAQAQRPFTIGISGGASAPISDWSDAAKTGFTLTANIGVKPVGTPFSLQAEGGWNQWDVKGTNANVRSLSLTGNLLYDLSMTPGVKPYVIGTAGLYHLTTSDNGAGGVFASSNSTNKLGLGVGAGIRMPLSGFDTYLEARYTHALDTSISFIPITFGVRF